MASIDALYNFFNLRIIKNKFNKFALAEFRSAFARGLSESKVSLLNLFLIILICKNSFAETEIDIYLQSRTYPKGGIVGVQTAYNYLLAGDIAHKFKYTYVKPSLAIESAGTYFGVNPEIIFYPIAISKFTMGWDFASYQGKPVNYDCVKYNCDGLLKSEYLKFDQAFGFDTYYGVIGYKKDVLMRNRYQKEFIDLVTGLPGHPHGDLRNSYYIVFGKKLNEQLKFFYLDYYAEMKVKRGFSRMHLLNVELTQDKWSEYFGIGLFNSGILANSVTFLFKLNYSFKKDSFGLF